MKNRQTDAGVPEHGDSGRRSESGPMSTVFVSTPGLLEESLRVMLDALPSVRVVGSASGCLSALYMVRELVPALVVIDSHLPVEDVKTLVEQLKREGLPTRALVLTMTRQQSRCALAAGADATFPKHACTDELNALLTRLRDSTQAQARESAPSALEPEI